MKQFGAKATQALLGRYTQSPNFRDGLFHNLEHTPMDMKLSKVPGLLIKQIKAKGRSPVKPLPVVPFDFEKFLAPSDDVKFIWYGHSVLLMRINNKTLLIDPMLGPDAAPTAPFKIKRFSENTLDIIDQFPPIDLMLITHDHYDHLDLASIKKLKSKTQQYYVALGVARHLISWGVDDNNITEFDWWDNKSFETISITFTPSRHFSGRGLSDRFKGLWGGWVFKTEKENIYFSGDGGYGKHFKDVGDKLGPFNIGFMECGQYNENWHNIHMFPEETVQAALDAQVQNAMAVHWAGFPLALHTWQDPIERFTKTANEKSLVPFSPKIGELFTINEKPTTEWWEGLE
jgi:L-ascorbate metabolism protein UlaG (beta-lactamase superfamily)